MKTFSGRKASQNEFEIMSLIQLLKEKGVKRYLEIGARHGDTFHLIMSELGQDAFGIALDFPGALWGKATSVHSLREAVKDLNSKNIESLMLLGDSRDREIINQITSSGKFDAIFIDGDHTLTGVTHDWNNYKDLSDIIIFHDIVGIGQFEKVHKNPVEVPILWERIKSEGKGEIFELVDNDSKMGIGVWIRKSPSSRPIDQVIN